MTVDETALTGTVDEDDEDGARLILPKPGDIVVPEPTPTDAERAARVATAQRLIEEAEALQRAKPPEPARNTDRLHTVSMWGRYQRFVCKLCPWDVLIHTGRTEAEAEEEIFQHYLTRHLGINPDEEEE